MTTTEIPPVVTEVEKPQAPPRVTVTTEPTAEPKVRVPRRGRFAGRLPYALAVLALAVGYGVGHNSNNPSPPVHAQPGVVTAAQINAMLAGTNGHPIASDRGFSQLENGVQHNHAWELPMNQTDRLELAREMTLARETAMRYPTLQDAVNAHMFRAGPFSPGLGTHMINVADYGYSAGAGVMTDAQIEHPLAWIYDGTKPTSPVAGLFYQASVPNPAGFIGPNDVWHQHHNICIVTSGGSIQAPLGADHDATQAQCDVYGGRLLPATGPLLHVWVVPGYEDSQGVYAHLNPAIMCNDGTYHVIATQNIGYRTSVCVDGTE